MSRKVCLPKICKYCKKEFTPNFCTRKYCNNLCWRKQANIDSNKYGKDKLIKSISQPIVLKETEKAYIAGIIDGEGCITMGKGGRDRSDYHDSITVEMACSEVPNFLYKLSGGSLKERNREGRTKKFWCWYIRAKGGEELLTQIIPYLVLKKRQAELFLEYRKTIGYSGVNNLPEEVIKIRNNIIAQIRILNYREVNTKNGINRTIATVSSN